MTKDEFDKLSIEEIIQMPEFVSLTNLNATEMNPVMVKDFWEIRMKGVKQEDGTYMFLNLVCKYEQVSFFRKRNHKMFTRK